MLMLAEQNWSLTVQVVAIAWGILQTLGLAYVVARQSEIKDLKSKLELATKTQVDERLSAWADMCAMRHCSIDKRLDAGDDQFGTVEERNTTIQLKVITEVTGMKEWMRGTFVSKDDLQMLIKAMRGQG